MRADYNVSCRATAASTPAVLTLHTLKILIRKFDFSKINTRKVDIRNNFASSYRVHSQMCCHENLKKTHETKSNLEAHLPGPAELLDS